MLALTAIKVVVDELSTYLRTKTIPDISGGSGQVSYSASNILIKDIKSSGSSVTAESRKGLTITLPNVAITLTGNWNYQWIWSYINIRDSGLFTASVTDVTFKLLFDLGYDSNGRPTMWTRSNVTQIGNVRVIFHGGSATIYNTFRGYVEAITRRLIYTTFNDALEDSINDWARNNLRNLDMRAPVKGVATLDYRLVSAPYIGNGYVQSLHRGEFFGINSNMEAPFLPSPMEDIPATSKMVAICVSDYVINSLGHVLYRYGYLTYTVALTEAEMSPEGPAETITLLMTATGRPNLNTDKNGIKLYLPATIVIKARQSTGELATVMTLDARAEINIIVEITEDKITARVENFGLKTDVTSPSINPLLETLCVVADLKYSAE
ncbi:hypothetical protein LSH36_234g00020 [Paralvinella palmiformis]|uniref:Lipid-binding serum glycoprotein N-terminal domain-containing protein n=1 Tax=Paralvinella palmiformis TaxID=53620 RepID=A0AAD9JNF9_9ANNE|nr:hypothetical protein LSH36_234g00020 [Paralvinella palmiformis]